MSYFCEICRKPFQSRQSLWAHNKRHALARKVIGQSGGPSKEVLNKILKPSSIEKLKIIQAKIIKKGESSNKNEKKLTVHESDTESDESDSTSEYDDTTSEHDGNMLLKRFNELAAKYDDDVDIETYEILMDLLERLKRLQFIDDQNYAVWKTKLQEEIDLETRVNKTTKFLLDNDKNQITHSLNLEDESAKTMYNLISEFENPETMKEIFKLLPNIKGKVLQCNLELLLNEMKKKRESVIQIFSRLNTDENDKEAALKSLKQDGYITNEQYRKLLIAPHDFDSYTKVIEGRGLWLRGP